MKLGGRFGGPHVWIAFFSLTAVFTVALVDLGRTSPGELAAVHRRVPELEGRNGCAECHGGWRTSMTEACVACHEDIGEQVEKTFGLHGVLPDGEAGACAHCHSDHHGSGFAMVNRHSFAQAGVPDPDAFEHELIGFPMWGVHLDLECSECHTNADELVLPEGEKRFLGLDQDCATCHEDPHEGQMAVGCAECHGQQSFDELYSQGHERFLPLVGGHGELGCRECHAEDTSHSLEALGNRFRSLVPRDCAVCHDSPHEEGFLAGVARQESMSAGESCVVCHEAEHVSFREPDLVVTPEHHAASGFELAEPHQEVGCAECHEPEVDDFHARYPGRLVRDCAVCHEDPHDGQFDVGPFAEAGCVGCHDRVRFEPHAFDVRDHELTALPLEGSHAEVECNTCHNLTVDRGPRIFRGTPTRCEACHEDAHRGFFDAEARRHPAIEEGECARCHEPTEFADVSEEVFDHGEWTTFEVEGAHAQGECTACHQRSAEPDEFGRTFGWVEEHFGPYEGCASCHEDPHEGEFDGPGLPELVDGRAGCARCHDQVSFRAFQRGFDHERWTGFPLDDNHAQAGCTACHEPLRRPTASGRTWARAAGTACSDCHANPHAGQFRVDDATDCSRCHSGSASFSALVFDHETDARFPLGEAHQGLECSACHLGWPTADGREVIRYRPLGTECTDCHGVNGQEQGRVRRGAR